MPSWKSAFCIIKCQTFVIRSPSLYIAHVMKNILTFWSITLSQIRNFLVFTQHYFHNRKKLLQGFSPFDHSICYRIHTYFTYVQTGRWFCWLKIEHPPLCKQNRQKGSFVSKEATANVILSPYSYLPNKRTANLIDILKKSSK